MSINGWMVKEDVVYTQNGILASYKKGHPAICDDVGVSWRSYAYLWSKSDGETQILYDFLHIVI